MSNGKTGGPGCGFTQITPNPCLQKTDTSLLVSLSKLPLVSPFINLSTSISLFVFPPLPCCLSLLRVCDHLTPGQQGSSFLPVCLLLLSSFTSWLDHQPCKEDLWPWSTQNGICWALGTRWGARCICSQQVSHTNFKPFVLVWATGLANVVVMKSGISEQLSSFFTSKPSNHCTL